MSRRTFTLDCSNSDNLTSCTELLKVITYFIEAAFPENASACNQATRSSLLELVDRMKNSPDNCEIITRQRPLLKTAINWYFEEIEKNQKKQQNLLQLIAKKKKKQDP